MSIKIEAQRARTRLLNRAVNVTQITPALMAELIKAAGLRAASLDQYGTAIRHLNECVHARAWLDAALLLLSIELPGWSLRRLAREDGICYCSLSRTPNIPIEFDDTVDASHSDPAVAIMLAQAPVAALRIGPECQPLLDSRKTANALNLAHEKLSQHIAIHPSGEGAFSRAKPGAGFCFCSCRSYTQRPRRNE